MPTSYLIDKKRPPRARLPEQECVVCERRYTPKTEGSLVCSVRCSAIWRRRTHVVAVRLIPPPEDKD